MKSLGGTFAKIRAVKSYRQSKEMNVKKRLFFANAN